MISLSSGTTQLFDGEYPIRPKIPGWYPGRTSPGYPKVYCGRVPRRLLNSVDFGVFLEVLS